MDSARADIEMRFVETEDELREVQRLRYDVYVAELGRYAARADHERRLLAEPEDDYSIIVSARDGADVVGTARLTWGGNPHGFSERQVDQYRLQPFLDEIPAERMGVGERAAVAASHRGSDLLYRIIEFGMEGTDDYGVRLGFGAAEPHLLPLYMSLGQVTYADRNINADEAGYLIPMMRFRPDAAATAGIGFDATDAEGNPKIPQCVQRALDSSGGAVLSHGVTRDADYQSAVQSALDLAAVERTGAFDDFSPDETERCLARSNVIACNRDDRVVKAGGTARNMFVVLGGTLEVRAEDGRPIGVLSPGDVFGETAFLLEQTRSVDVFAATDGVRVLSLSDGTIRRMIRDDPTVAAKFLFNLSKMLCWRVALANERSAAQT